MWETGGQDWFKSALIDAYSDVSSEDGVVVIPSSGQSTSDLLVKVKEVVKSPGHKPDRIDKLENEQDRIIAEIENSKEYLKDSKEFLKLDANPNLSQTESKRWEELDNKLGTIVKSYGTDEQRKALQQIENGTIHLKDRAKAEEAAVDKLEKEGCAK